MPKVKNFLYKLISMKKLFISKVRVFFNHAQQEISKSVFKIIGFPKENSLNKPNIKYDNFKKIENLLINKFYQAKEALSQKDNKNIALEIAIFFSIFMVSLIINDTLQSYSKLFFELVIVSFAYFAAYYFLPKREFEFKTTLIFLLSTIILTPLFFLAYETEVAINLLKSISFLSLFVGLAFRIDFSQKNKINVLILTEKIITQDEIKNIKKIYNVIGVIHFDETVYEDFRNFYDINSATKCIDIFKIIPIFLLPTRIIYIANESRSNIDKLIVLASNLNLPIYKFGEETVISIDDITPNFSLPKVTLFSRKNIYVNFDGNASLLEIIKFMSQQSNISLTIVCPCEYLAKLISNSLDSERTCSIRIGDISSFLKLEQIDIVIFSMPYNDENLAAERLRESVKNNLIYTTNTVNNCIKYGIKNIFVISTLNALKAENWVGISHRLSELYIQNLDYQNKGDIKIIPIRLPSTDYFNFSTKMPKVNKFICASILLKLLDDLLGNVTMKGRVYSIIPKTVLDDDFINKAIKVIGGRNSNSKSMIIKQLDSFSPLNEHLEPYNVSDVYFTNFVNKNMYDLSELKIIENSKSFRELTDGILNSVYEKIK